jgi:hypothetical protein
MQGGSMGSGCFSFENSVVLAQKVPLAGQLLFGNVYVE